MALDEPRHALEQRGIDLWYEGIPVEELELFSHRVEETVELDWHRNLAQNVTEDAGESRRHLRWQLELGHRASERRCSQLRLLGDEGLEGRKRLLEVVVLVPWFAGRIIDLVGH